MPHRGPRGPGSMTTQWHHTTSGISWSHEVSALNVSLHNGLLDSTVVQQTQGWGSAIKSVCQAEYSAILAQCSNVAATGLWTLKQLMWEDLRAQHTWKPSSMPFHRVGGVKKHRFGLRLGLL